VSAGDVPEWLAEADRVLGDEASAEHDVDRVVAEISSFDLAALPGGVGASQLDPVVLQRIIAVLRVRRAAAAVELADLGRQRADLARRHRGVAGYTRTGL
jgi:hypothetical protein